MAKRNRGVAFWGRQDKAAERRALVERSDRTGEYVYLTDEEHLAKLVAAGYIPGAGCTGEGMGES